MGIIPEFSIRDVRGESYVLKFDPPGFMELCSGAEVIVSRILFAAGYNVPETKIVYVDPDLLLMGEDCTLEQERGRLCPLTSLELERLKKEIHLLPDGKARALASKALPGKPLGPFLFAGTRKDDFNDIVPHEHRRELRGLFPLCAWLKHFDIKNSNTQDIFVEENGCFYVRHYLIDFRTTLGSDIAGPMPSYLGHEMIVDIYAIASNLMFLGFKVQSWESAGDVEFPSIGRIDDQNYDPGKARTNYYIPAFMNMTNLDGYWGAKLVMSFSDEQLAAIVKEADYSNEAAARFLLEMLISRRDKTGRHWFSRTNPMDRFQLRRLPGGNWFIHFVDLGLFYGLWTGEKTRYRYDFSVKGKKVIQHASLAEGSVLSLDRLDLLIKKRRPHLSILNQDRREITLWLTRDLGQTWSKSVKVSYILDPSTGRPVLMGVRREE